MDSYKLSSFGLYTANATRYAPVSVGDREIGWLATEANAEEIVASAGTLKNLYIELAAAPGGVQTAVFTLRKNGADTTITATVTGAATTASDTTNTVTVAAGDRIAWKCVGSATASAATTRLSVDYAGDTANESLLLGRVDVSVTVDTYSCVDGYTDFDAGSFNAAKQLIATAGTVKKLYVRLDAAPTGTETQKFTLYKNGLATALTVTITGVATTGNDTANSFTVAAGDKIAIFHDESAGAAATAYCWGMVFTADVANEFPIVAGTSADPSSAAVNFNHINAQDDVTFDATEANRRSFGRASTFKNMYCEVTTAPGASKSFTFTLRQNAADTLLTAAISEAGTTANVTSSVTVANNDDLSMEITPAGTPTAPAEISWGFAVTLVAPVAANTGGTLMMMGV